MFDMTFNDIKKAKKLMPDLLKAGYNPANIHLVWILQEYRIALKQNKDPERDRVVPKNIMFHTHEGAGKTIYELLAKKSKPIALNGSISVILNNPKNTIYFEPTGNESNPKKKVIKDFKYLTLKKRGQRMFRDQIVMKELFFWIKASIPKGEFSKFMQAKVDNPELDESFKQFHKEEQALRFIDLLPKKVKHAIRRIAHKDKYKAALHMYHGLKKDPDAKKRLTDKKMKEIAADHFKLSHKEFEAILNRKTRYEDTSLLDSLEKEMGDTDEFFELNQVGVKTIHDSFEIGTDEYRNHCQDMTPGQPILSFKLANKVIERNDIDLFANEDEIIDKYKKRYGDGWKDELQKAVLRMKKEL